MLSLYDLLTSAEDIVYTFMELIWSKVTQNSNSSCCADTSNCNNVMR